MKSGKTPDDFLSNYSDEVVEHAVQLREVILRNLPEILEQVDEPARMIAYCYGQKYVEMICTIIPSKKGIKLGFAYGNELPDPHKLLEGTGKISRYVQIHSKEIIQSAAVKRLIKDALAAYKIRVVKK